MGVLPIYSLDDFKTKHERWNGNKDSMDAWLKTLHKMDRRAVLYFFAKPRPACPREWKELYLDCMYILEDNADYRRERRPLPRSYLDWTTGRSSARWNPSATAASTTTPSESSSTGLTLDLRLRHLETPSDSVTTPRPAASSTTTRLLSALSERPCDDSLSSFSDRDGTSPELPLAQHFEYDAGTNHDLERLLRPLTPSESGSCTLSTPPLSPLGSPSLAPDPRSASSCAEPSSGLPSPSTESCTLTSESPRQQPSGTGSKRAAVNVDSCLPTPKRAPSVIGSVKNASGSSPIAGLSAHAKKDLYSRAAPIARRTRSNKNWWTTQYGI